jgi:catechol 2,3-dioxygenase-like lactoylglutathione lyase family enzyme
MKMSVGMLDHYNVSTRKLDETVNFYENVLGFTNGPRPPFNFPGAWLYSSGHPVTTNERDQALGTRGTILSTSRRGA